METARLRLEHAAAQWAETKAKYRDLKVTAWHESEEALRHWKQRLQEYETRLEDAKEHWRSLLQNLQSIPASTL